MSIPIPLRRTPDGHDPLVPIPFLFIAYNTPRPPTHLWPIVNLVGSPGYSSFEWLTEWVRISLARILILRTMDVKCLPMSCLYRNVLRSVLMMSGKSRLQWEQGQSALCTPLSVVMVPGHLLRSVNCVVFLLPVIEAHTDGTSKFHVFFSRTDSVKVLHSFAFHL
jgi:hypothetical protein